MIRLNRLNKRKTQTIDLELYIQFFYITCSTLLYMLREKRDRKSQSVGKNELHIICIQDETKSDLSFGYVQMYYN